MDEKITSRENAKIKYACRLASGAACRRTEGRRNAAPDARRQAYFIFAFSRLVLFSSIRYS